LEIRIAVVELSRSNNINMNINNLINTLNNIEEDINLIFLPENWLSKNPFYEEEYISFIDNIYKNTNKNIFFGLTYIKDIDRIVSRGYHILDGKIGISCEKIFPSKAVGERGKVSSGKFISPINFQDVNIGCVACVDIFYPEISRLYSLLGVDLIYNPAAITLDRVPLWRSVLSTRASENTIFTIGVNSIGIIYPDNRVTGGGSAVFGPDGEPLKPINTRHAKIYDINLEYIEKVRLRWAFNEDLKAKKPLEIYLSEARKRI